MRAPLLLAALGAAGCGGGGHAPDASPPPPDARGPVVVDLDADPPALLSAYRLFTWDPAAGFAWNDRVVPYDLNTPLFSDYAVKQRAIYLPPGSAATYDPDQAFALPVGAVVLKTFAFPSDFRTPAANVQLVETRLLIHHADGWHALPYIWTADQRDAVLSPAGEVRAISFVDAAGAPRQASYLIPERNQCQSCHARKVDATAPIETVLIGVKARHLNRLGSDGVNQLARLTALGMLTGAPAQIPAATDFRPIEAAGPAGLSPADLDAAARSYLDINCAHCHNPQGVQGMTSQLFLDRANTDPFHLGVCKRPGSAGTGNGGLVFDLVPGDPDSSILYFRTATTQVGAMMPLLGRSLAHARGVELLRAWIAAMPATACVAAVPSGG
jgi:uncharacterized repeat protein (TIGR03806 family)